MSNDLKTCTLCKAEKPFSEFYKRTRSNGTVTAISRCKVCIKAIEQTEKRQAVKAVWRKKYQQAATYRAKLERQKELRQTETQKEHDRQRAHKYNSQPENKVRAAARQRKYRRTLVGKLRQRVLDERYRATKHGRNNRRILEQNRLARKRANGGSGVSSEEWNAILESHNNQCAYCGMSGEYVTLCMDHVIPLSRGGKHQPENIVPACRPCNSRKHNKLGYKPVAA